MAYPIGRTSVKPGQWYVKAYDDEWEVCLAEKTAGIGYIRVATCDHKKSAVLIALLHNDAMKSTPADAGQEKQ